MKLFCYSIVGKSLDLAHVFNTHGVVSAVSNAEALGKAVNKYKETFPESIINITDVFELNL
jgi:hypothetical protein